ncbi:hypothetical protein SKAU_G00331460 [Synaphobranchus kaupii]|uniref:Fucolectin tachylectin-4 pentraxin-1 domain-containing protein n=1 Tax=Synaphobranchus kaupii TaxID=118154 RepID=A0A9Q1ELE1_SYNKA|nr:hypothetical protein SKAU_G00331460 [Synaphobranchus kaupii]
MSQSDQKTKNVALRGKATQSAIYLAETTALCHASNAIDGNQDSFLDHGSCFHTAHAPNSWWRVDLLQTYIIASVTITNRNNNEERISGAQIHIGNSLENNGIDNPQCSVIGSMALGENETFYCEKPMIGRYVTVSIPRAEYLYMCEVELADKQITTNYPPVKTCCFTDRMKVKMMILLLQILAISNLKPVSAWFPSYQYMQENVALRGKATQSAMLRNDNRAYSHAGNAIDGNRDPDFFHGSCSQTEDGINHWWRVDLLETYVVASVTITNRGDCCGERINGAEIHIGNSLENNGIDNPQCSVVDSMVLGETKNFQCEQPMSGRYVTVYLPKTDHLNLCEVEVNAWVPVPKLYC